MTSPPTSPPTPPPVPDAESEGAGDPGPAGRPGGNASGIPLRYNPVLRRELIERVQGVRVVVMVTVWLALLTGILLLAYQGTVGINEAAGLDVATLGRVGRELYEWVLFGMMVLVLFLVPGVTAGSVTGERERQTLVPLQMTLMRPVDIIVGKLAAALAFLVLLVVVAMPLLAVSILVGGVGILDVVRGLGMLVFTGLVLGAVGVLFSSVLRRTTGATVLTYAVTLIFAVGSFIGLAAWAIADATTGIDDRIDPPAHIMALNPFAAVADALPRSGGGLAFTDDTFTPFGGLRTLNDELDGGQDFDQDGFRIDDRGPRLWIWYVVAGAGVLGFAVNRAAAAVRTPAERER